MTRKNLVFILTDTLRKDKVSVYNSEIKFTEALDDFGQEATVFSEAVANAPWTLPSHASIFTGEYPWEHGATQRNLKLDTDTDLIAEKLAGNGYRSKCISVNGFLSRQFGLVEGFSEVDNLSLEGVSGLLTKARRSMDGWLASPGMEGLKRRLTRLGGLIFHYWVGGSRTEDILERSREFVGDGEEPFFLFVNLMDAHEPYFPPEEYREKHGCVHPRDICQNHSDYEAGRKDADFEEISRMYDACVDYMDDQIGRFFDYLKNEGLWDDTVVVVASDHGQMLGEDDRYGHQYSVAEPLVKVPLMVKEMGQESFEQQFELRELYHLLPELLGLESSERQFGTEYAMGGYEFPDLMRPRIPRHRWDEFYRRHHFVRTEDGKLVRTEKGDGGAETKFTSFNGELGADIKKAMERRLEEIPDVEEGELLEDSSEEIKDKLKDLGYG